MDLKVIELPNKILEKMPQYQQEIIAAWNDEIKARGLDDE